MSPSTRRAWIEICKRRDDFRPQKVALHPEGVDRNRTYTITRLTPSLSPSTRRAWIEIVIKGTVCNNLTVALHPEGVDRN